MFRNGGTNLVCIFGKYAKHNLPAGLGQIARIDNHLQPVRCMGKHYDPKFKKQRKEKVLPCNKDEFTESRKRNRLRDFREELKLLGKFPVNMKHERPISLFSSLTIEDPYDPPRGDGKYSDVLSKAQAKTVGRAKMAGKNLRALRKLKSLDPTYVKDEFLELAKDIYIKAHTALADDPDDLIQYVTELAYPKMTVNTKYKTIKWKFIESLEPPSIVQIRIVSVTDSASFGQITVRFHTQQSLAVYDRFGRLMQGSEILKKDVLEYIVFEKNLVLPSSNWRLHAKFFPLEVDQHCYTTEKTYIKPDLASDQSEALLDMSETERNIYETLSK